MIRNLAIFLTFALCSVCGSAEENQLDSNQALFALLSARAACGYDNPEAGNAVPARASIVKALQQANPPSLYELKRFFSLHQAKDPAADLGQYISFALSIGPPPDFEYRYKPTERSPEVAPLDGLEKLLAKFWTEANLDELWKRAQPGYDQAIGFYHSPVTKAILEANAYLRNPTTGYLGRRFQIFVELAAKPGLIQSRSLKDDYFVVVGPAGHDAASIDASVEEQTRQIRHAYLHYVLDPLSVKYATHLQPKKALMDISDTAPALDEAYKKDFLLLATESLIKAVEARLSPASKRAEMVDTALREGFILTPYFADHLPDYEKQQEAMRLYLPEMIDGISLRAETKRLNGVQFSQAKLTERPDQPVTPKLAPLTPAQQALTEAENYSFDKQYPKAKESFNRVLELPDDNGLHGRAYFGLARIAALQKDPELAERLFQKTLGVKPDPETESWTQLYLGRLAAAAGDNDQATAHYQAALNVTGGAAKAQEAAKKALSTPATER